MAIEATEDKSGNVDEVMTPTNVEDDSPTSSKKKRKKKKKKGKKVVEEPKETINPPSTDIDTDTVTDKVKVDVPEITTGGETNDNEDQELVAAAALWEQHELSGAEDDEGFFVHREIIPSPKNKKKEATKSGAASHAKKEKKNASNLTPPSSSQEIELPLPEILSLHLTQVPYQSTEAAIRKSLREEGCNMISVRLVYDTDRKAGTKKFRGVAFVDMADEASYRNALALHGTVFLGNKRKVNVRPTRTKTEMAGIVQRTKEKLVATIGFDKASSKSEDKKSFKNGDKRKRGKKDETGEKGNFKKGKSTKDKKGGEETKEDGGDAKKRKTSKKGEKISKHERAKKAAIIRGMGKGRK